jgi:hypothetical protein
MAGAAFAGRGAADHLGAVGDRLLGMERAVLAGEALADDLGVLVDENGHLGCDPSSHEPSRYRRDRIACEPSEERYNKCKAEYVHHAGIDRVFVYSFENRLTKEYAERDCQCRPNNKHPEIKRNHL